MEEKQQLDEHGVSIGRIPLKTVRVKRGEERSANPMNLLVPYLDLFARLDDDELSRLACVDTEVVVALRKQVIAIDRGLAPYVDLLPRLSDNELVRLTGATPKTIRFWRLCQPRVAGAERGDGVVAKNARATASTKPMPAADGAPQKEPGTPEPRIHESNSGQHNVAQSSVDELMAFSGDPFPGFDEQVGTPDIPDSDELSIEEVDELATEGL